QHVDRVEIVGGDRQGRLLIADPTFTSAEPRNRLALGNVLQIVPIMELVGMRGREIEGGDQQTPAHGILLWHEPEAGTRFRKRSCTKTSWSARHVGSAACYWTTWFPIVQTSADRA